MRYARIIGRGNFLNYIFFLISIIDKKIQIKWPLISCVWSLHSLRWYLPMQICGMTVVAHILLAYDFLFIINIFNFFQFKKHISSSNNVYKEGLIQKCCQVIKSWKIVLRYHFDADLKTLMQKNDNYLAPRSINPNFSWSCTASATVT